MVPAAVRAAATATARIVGHRRCFLPYGVGFFPCGRAGAAPGRDGGGGAVFCGGGCLVAGGRFPPTGACGNTRVPAGPDGTRWAGLSTVSLFASHGSTGRPWFGLVGAVADGHGGPGAVGLVGAGACGLVEAGAFGL